MKNIAILGMGTMGTYTAQALKPRVERITVYEPDITKRAKAQANGYTIAQSPQEAVAHADVVMYCVPANTLEELMRKTLPSCKAGTIIAGQTSRKALEARPFEEYAREHTEKGLEMVTLHTMCNPVQTDPQNAILGIIRHHASEETYQKMYTLLSPLSRRVEEFATVAEHDTVTAHTQINTSRTFLSIASAFARAQCFPMFQKEYANGLDEAKFSLAMRVSSLPAHVYRGIQFGSPEGKVIVKTALDVEHHLYDLMVRGKKEEYAETCRKAKDYIFQGRTESILPLEAINQLGNNTPICNNSHLSFVQWAVTHHALQRSPFQDLKGTTPMHTSLLVLTDSLFLSPHFEQVLEAPFKSADLRGQDLIFDRELTGWSDAILYENEEGYNAHHAHMDEQLKDEVRKPAVEKAKQVVAMCTQALENFRKSS